MSSTTLQSAIDAQREKLRPANAAEISSACKALLTHAKVTGMKQQAEVGEMHAVWSAHCRDMPATLLASGLAEVLKHWKSTFCLPAPGAVWEQIEPDLRRVRQDLATLENAMRMTADNDNPDADDRSPTSETQDVIDRTLAMLKSHTQGKRIY